MLDSNKFIFLNKVLFTLINSDIDSSLVFISSFNLNNISFILLEFNGIEIINSFVFSKNY